MPWRFLKPDRRLADKPSVLKRFLCCGLLLFSAVSVVHGACLPPHTGSVTTNNGVANSPATTIDWNGGSATIAASEARTLASANQPDYTIRRNAREVRLEFTVADERGRLITSLALNDIRVFDDQSPVSEIRQFLRQDDLPLQIGILLDVSDSVQKTVLREKLATQLFVQRILRPQTDRAFLMTFSADLKVWQPSTGDSVSLQQAVERIGSPASTTNLYDALFYACRNNFAQAAEGAVQRILLLFSDGNDTGSLHALPDAIAQAQRHDIQIYAVSVHPKGWNSRGDEILMHVADTTGGHFYIANSEKDFPAVFDAMAQQMRTQYSLSFPPVRETAGFHSLRLETTIPRKVQVHARQAYYFEAQ